MSDSLYGISDVNTELGHNRNGIDYDRLKNDKKYVIKMLNKSKLKVQEICKLGENLFLDKEVALAAVSYDGSFLLWFPAFKDDFDVVMAAYKNDKGSIKYASDRFKNTIGKINIDLKYHPEYFAELSSEFFEEENKDILKYVLEIIKEGLRFEVKGAYKVDKELSDYVFEINDIITKKIDYENKKILNRGAKLQDRESLLKNIDQIGNQLGE